MSRGIVIRHTSTEGYHFHVSRALASLGTLEHTLYSEDATIRTLSSDNGFDGGMHLR